MAQRILVASLFVLLDAPAEHPMSMIARNVSLYITILSLSAHNTHSHRTHTVNFD